LPFDCSQCVFVATANSLEGIPLPLLDRMEVVRLSGYTHREKVAIALQYLVPKQLAAHGLAWPAGSAGNSPGGQLTGPLAVGLALPEATVAHLVSGYTREAGVRELDQVIILELDQIIILELDWVVIF
jgi:ATP-dependent Lon protease